jgi:hypothetical protein
MSQSYAITTESILEPIELTDEKRNEIRMEMVTILEAGIKFVMKKYSDHFSGKQKLELVIDGLTATLLTVLSNAIPFEEELDDSLEDVIMHLRQIRYLSKTSPAYKEFRAKLLEQIKKERGEH